MALPSAWRLITGLSGQAMAAPTAMGMPAPTMALAPTSWANMQAARAIEDETVGDGDEAVGVTIERDATRGAFGLHSGDQVTWIG